MTQRPYGSLTPGDRNPYVNLTVQLKYWFFCMLTTRGISPPGRGVRSRRLKQSLGLEKVSTERRPVNLREALLLNGSDVLGRTVALRLREMVPRVLVLVGDHEGVSRDLRHDRGGSDARHTSVALDEGLLLGMNVHGITVDEDAVRLDARVFDGSRHGHAERTGHSHGIDGLCLHMGNADGNRNVGDSRGECLTLCGGELL